MLDPFAGSGTTLVQALESGLDSAGVDIAAFNCLLMRVKTARYNPFVLEHELRDALARFERGDGDASRRAARMSRVVRAARRARAAALPRRSSRDYEHADVLRVVLARAARSARLTTHFDLDFPQAPQLEPYWCHKHKRECRPVERADHFLRRYTLDTLARLKEFARVRDAARRARGAARRRARARAAGPFDARRHLAAVPGPDRLPRAAPLRVRAARARRPARARDRRRRAGTSQRGARGVRRRHRRRCSRRCAAALRPRRAAS